MLGVDPRGRLIEAGGKIKKRGDSRATWYCMISGRVQYVILYHQVALIYGLAHIKDLGLENVNF